MTDVAGAQPRIATADWAQAKGISAGRAPPTVADYDEPCPLDARQIASRVLVLQGVIAIASGIDPEPVIAWLTEQHLWDGVTPAEREFVAHRSNATEQQVMRFRWQQEAEWALLWAIGKVEHLGLPVKECDTLRLVDEIVSPLGGDVEPFLLSSHLRPPGELLAEVDRHYNLWCCYIKARRAGPQSVPFDLLPDVLFQREYAFEWLHGFEEWDDVQCDA